MNPTTVAIRAGGTRAWIELRQAFTSTQGLLNLFLFPILILIALFFMRHGSFHETGLKLGTLALPGVLGSVLAFNGLYWMTEYLVLDREDGTLLRAKAIPNGMVGYLIGKLGASAGQVLIQVAFLLVVGGLIVGGLSVDGVGGWLTLAWVVTLGLLAVLPLGAILGSIIEGARGTFFLTMPLMALIGISGIYYPITVLPGWVQALAQVFPMYWLGLGMRSALLPADTVVVEIGQSWRHLETVAVLGVWALIGLLVAPMVLRRMARGESGSTVASRREKALQRAY
ncbi:ABC transporter permease [Nocardia uniformis]|uniref:Transport permease protein n=1 Tax=Nocardia uniformis TaxID=53432 RepID=A0A849CDE5_9NOCA|nr:ABC transporter permease [Nocardia uniformis]NNH74435.1 ABC transporter permease [Nocardia uniformis]